MPARNEPAVKDSLDAITDALLTGSRLLAAISAGSIARVDDLALQPRNRVLSGRARGKTRGCRPHGTPCMLALSAQGHRLPLQAEVILTALGPIPSRALSELLPH
jgi:hypothetical protein